MKTWIVSVVTCTLLSAVPAAGVSSPQPAAGQEPAREQPRPGNASGARPAGERPRFQVANIRVELTVTDSAGESGPQKKSVSMMIADGHMGRIRAQRGGGGDAMLNVDATPTIDGEKVRLQISLEYVAPAIGPAATRVASVSEFVTALLDPGKPLVISQSADPAADRKVAVEVTATILK